MNRLAREGLLGSLVNIDLSICESCLARKAIRKPFDKSTRVENSLQIIHSNIYRPMSMGTKYEAMYFITFIDDHSHFGHVYLVSPKFKALDCFRSYLSLVEN